MKPIEPGKHSINENAELSTREIRAQYDEDTIIVYQAFNSEIASSAVANQTFVSPPFKKERMTWIKPSFLWMMYRSAWATKKGQEHVLRISMTREGFNWALQHSCLSHFDSSVHSSYNEWKQTLATSPVRIQWDPERNIFLQPLVQRSIQIGLSGIAVEKYIKEWIFEITDITDACVYIKSLLIHGDIEDCHRKLPVETNYFLPEELNRIVNASNQ